MDLKESVLVVKRVIPHNTNNGSINMHQHRWLTTKWPKSDADVRRAIQYARCNGVNIAVRTGGHQFSGASSTDAENIQLDMSEAYKNKTSDFIVEEHDGAQPIVHVGISFSLFEFNTLMSDHGLFVSASQCG